MTIYQLREHLCVFNPSYFTQNQSMGDEGQPYWDHVSTNQIIYQPSQDPKHSSISQCVKSLLGGQIWTELLQIVVTKLRTLKATKNLNVYKQAVML